MNKLFCELNRSCYENVTLENIDYTGKIYFYKIL